MKVIGTKRTTFKMVLLRENPLLGSWIINEFENLGKRGSALGKHLEGYLPNGQGEIQIFFFEPWHLQICCNQVYLEPTIP